MPVTVVDSDGQVITETRAKTELTTAKGKHTRLANQILAACAADDEGEREYIENLAGRLEGCMDELYAKLNIYLEITEGEEGGELDKNTNLNETAIKEHLKYLKRWDKPPQPVQKADMTDKIILPRPKVTLPEMKAFSCEIRDYANFKSTFRKKYEPHYGDLASVILKDNLLTGHCAKMCKSLESVDEIFTTLDKSYGDPGKLAEAVLSDIGKIKICRKNNLEDLRNLVETIQIAEADLKSVNLEHHIKQYHTVTLLTEKLPLDTRRRWAFEIARRSISTNDRYDEILNFLDLEIRTMELLGPTEEESGSESHSHPPSKHARQARGESDSQQMPQHLPPTNPGTNSRTWSCVVHPNMSNHTLCRCRIFRKYSTPEQLKILEDNKQICRSCLEVHINDSSECNREIWPCQKPNCGKRHYNFVHEACGILSDKDPKPHAYSVQTVVINRSAGNTCSSLSPGQRIRVANTNGAIGLINALWDNGSNVTLILNSVCQRYGFKKFSNDVTTLKIEIVGGSSYEVESYLVTVPLYDLQNKKVTTIYAYSVTVIGSKLATVDLTEAFNVFGIPPREQGDLLYPAGDIQLLIGSDNAHIILHHVSEINGLRLSESVLGRVIWGRHPSFTSSPVHSRAVIVRKEAKKNGSVENIWSMREDLVPSLFSTEIMGIQCIPNCGRCACGKCAVNGDKMTPKERFEYDQIKNSITLEDKVLTASYPLRKDLSTLPDNYELAYKRLIQLEKQLANDPEAARIYKEQFRDMMQRGLLRKLTREERNEWKGAVQYLPYFIVYKLTSTSTPARVVFDPSSQYKGKSVNEYWVQGPCLLNDQLGILYRFREDISAIAGDISKMYNTVHTREREWHLHRVLWRDDPTQEPDIYVIVRNSFGSGPAGTVAIAAKDYLAENNREEFPRAADTIINQTYVDDVLDSTPSKEQSEQLTSEVDYILGLGSFKIKKWIIVNSSTSYERVANAVAPPASYFDRHSDNLSRSEDESIHTSAPALSKPNTEEGRSHDNLTPNQVHIGGEQESILGVAWDTTTDEFFFRIKLNFSKKKKKIRTGPNLEPGQIFNKALVPLLSRRLIMSQVYGLYDIIGFLVPFVVELKFALGKLWRLEQKEIDWDEQIPEEHDAHWRKLFDTFFQISKLTFPRCLRPCNYQGKPILVMYSDSSMIAFAATAYIWWECDNNTRFSRLIAAKSRMWPIKPDDWISVERGELQGAVLSKRLSNTIQKEMRVFFSEIVYIIDSEIVFSQINMDSHFFNVFVGHRIAEIRSGTNTNQWWITRSENNACADLASRGTQEISSLDKNSTWQNGPDWLSQPRESWPISQTVKSKRPIPELRCQDLERRVLNVRAKPVKSCSSTESTSSHELYRHVYACIQSIGEGNIENPADGVLRKFSSSQEDFIASLIDLTRHNQLQLWLAVTFRILNAVSFPTHKFFQKLCSLKVILPEQRDTALNFWIRQAQKLLMSRLRSGQLKTLTPFTDEQGIVRVNGRSPREHDSYQPILLPHNHPISRLIVITFHRRGHGGAVATAASTRAEYHILQLRQLCRKIRGECMLCRIREERLLQVPMGSLPTPRTRPCYAFEHSACDITGPFHVKIPGRNTRSRTTDAAWYKAFLLIFNCLSTRAIHLELMQGMDTDAFLLAFRRFVCIRGQPKSCWSDNGSQIIAADKELQSLVKDLDEDRMIEYGAKNGTKWEFTSPGSPWQNGVSESLIRSLKISLRKITTPDQKLPVLELQTIFYEIAELLNERPINMGHQGASGNDFDSETNTYICPNQLLLGRSTVRIPAGPFQSVPLSSKNRFRANQTIVTHWWMDFNLHYVPQLITQQKWFRSSRPVRVGDIVHVRDINPIRGDWNMGEIIEIKQSRDSIPRNVLIRYKTVAGGYGKTYKSTPSRTQWRDVKNLAMILPVEERSELDPDAEIFVSNTGSSQ